MEHTEKSNTIATGLAMFSMFFGAGNVVFPLALGLSAQDANFWAILGLLISAVGIPFTGLIAMTLFNGDYTEFFNRIGKIPGSIISVAILGLIGPFGALPRCITLSHATVQLYVPNLSLITFSIASCLLIFLLTYKRTRILEILGYVLTPVLIGSLAIIIVKGILFAPPMPETGNDGSVFFLKGLLEGYQTMDLLGAFFFSSVILAYLEKDSTSERSHWHMIKLALKASFIGAGLLALTYIGFSYVAAYNSQLIGDVPKDELAGRLANLVLGPYAGIIASIAVALACLTTAIALASVFAEFIHKDVSKERISYAWGLIITLIISFLVSTLEFSGIVHFLAPILQVLYPALIALSILNILYKLYGFKPVKIPVLIVFCLSLAHYLWNR